MWSCDSRRLCVLRSYLLLLECRVMKARVPPPPSEEVHSVHKVQLSLLLSLQVAMAAVDSFYLLYREIARSCNCYMEALALVGAWYTARKSITVICDFYSLIRLHFIPRLGSRPDLIKQYGRWAVVSGNLISVPVVFLVGLYLNRCFQQGAAEFNWRLLPPAETSFCALALPTSLQGALPSEASPSLLQFLLPAPLPTSHMSSAVCFEIVLWGCQSSQKCFTCFELHCDFISVPEAHPDT